MATASRGRVNIKRSAGSRSAQQKRWFGVFRFVLYGFVGLSTEIIFYNLVKFGRRVPLVDRLFQFQWKVDPRLNLDAVWDAPLVTLYGQCSLWMFLVYAVASFCLIEPIYRRLVYRPLALRAVLYGLVILAFEAVSGWVLVWLTGYKIWFYDDRLNVIGMTSLYVLPIWMATGLLVELIYRELMDPDLVKALESPLPPTPIDPLAPQDTR